jgi:hypothetical protein
VRCFASSMHNSRSFATLRMTLRRIVFPQPAKAFHAQDPLSVTAKLSGLLSRKRHALAGDVSAGAGTRSANLFCPTGGVAGPVSGAFFSRR